MWCWGGELALIGNQALMREHGIAVPAGVLAGPPKGL